MMSTNYNRGDVGIVPVPFVTSDGALQKALPVMVPSNHPIDGHFDDLIAVGITSQIVETPETEYKVVKWTEDFLGSF